MAKRIDVTKVVNDFNALKNEESKINYAKGLVYRHYVPFGEKYMVLKGMLDKSIYTNSIGNKFINMSLSKINFTLAAISMYTLIDFIKDKNEKVKAFESYDLIVSSDLLRYLLAEIGETEITELTSVNGTIVDTFNYENNNIKNYISAQLMELKDGSSAVFDQIISVVGSKDFIEKIKNNIG